MRLVWAITENKIARVPTLPAPYKRVEPSDRAHASEIRLIWVALHG